MPGYGRRYPTENDKVIMQAGNPYKPPVALAAEVAPDLPPRFFASMIPACLSLGLTLVAWVVLVSTWDRIVGRSFSMLIWSITLFLASSLSILAVNRVWRSAIHPFAFGFVFALFCVVFLVAEGDPSNGTDSWDMASVYGTLFALPFTSYLAARRSSQAIFANPKLQDGGG